MEKIWYKKKNHSKKHISNAAEGKSSYDLTIHDYSVAELFLVTFTQFPSAT